MLHEISELQYGLLFHADGKLLSCLNPQRIPTCSNVNGSMRVGSFLSRVNVKKIRIPSRWEAFFLLVAVWLTVPRR
jgi:hypothetical protein